MGLPHDLWGEVPHAFVVLKAGAAATGEDLRQFARDRLAHFKAPHGVTFLGELPKTATGKVQKYVLRASCSQRRRVPVPKVRGSIVNLPTETSMMRSDLKSWVSSSCVAFIFFFLAACAEQKKPAKEAAPVLPPDPVTARFAFQRLSIQARMWAADAQLLRIASANLKEVPSLDGKYPVWHATFVSSQLKKARSFSYSVVDSPGNAHAGVLRGREESWLGPTGQAQPFPFADAESGL